MGTKRTTLRLSDDRQRLLDQAAGIVAISPDDDPPRGDVIDAEFTHLIQSAENIDEARDEYDPRVIQDIANTDVFGVYYRTSLESRWR